MKSNAELSIIVPVFNGERYIEHTIQNLLGASYQNLELLLIDDGSTDNSFAICKKYEALDCRVKAYHKENSGVADTRNYGLDHASGDYIGFCDQDDEISSEMYETMMNRIQKDNSEAAVCGFCRKKADGKRVVFGQYTDAVYLKQEIHDKLLLPLLFRGFAAYENQEITIFPSIWTCIISKKLIEEKRLRFCSFVDYEDDLMMLTQVYLHAGKVSTLSGIFYNWNTNVYSETYQRRGRWVDRLEERQKKRVNYVKRELEDNGIAKDIINKYEYVLCCANVLQLLDNLCLSEEKLRIKIERLRDNESVSFIQPEKNFVLPGKGFVRNTWVIMQIRRKHFYTAYFLNKGINFARYFVERHHLAEILERSTKRILAKRKRMEA